VHWGGTRRCPIEARTLFILFRNYSFFSLELLSAMLRYLVKRDIFFFFFSANNIKGRVSTGHDSAAALGLEASWTCSDPKSSIFNNIVLLMSPDLQPEVVRA
jgi:hypothetical protein